jgi:predicted ATP-grasp superfamily ATP-dependent carboligase
MNTPAVIFGDSLSAYGCVRSLAAINVPLHLVSRKKAGIACQSRFVRTLLQVSPDAPDFLNIIASFFPREIGDEAVLIITEDGYLDALSRHISDLRPGWKATFPASDVVRNIREKQKTLEIAARLGIPVPKTQVVRVDDDLETLLRGSGEISYPVIVRPEVSNSWPTRGECCANVSELMAVYEKWGMGNTSLVQEMIPGEEDQLINVSAVLNSHSEVLAVFMNRKRRSTGKFGTGTLVVSDWSDLASDYSVKLLRELRFYGYAEAEFKFDSRDGKLKFIEVNGRVSMLNSHALGCGIDLVQLMYLEALTGPLDAPVAQRCEYEEGVLWWYLPYDVKSIWRNKYYRNPMKLINSFKGRVCSVEPFWWRDLQPFWASTGGLLFRKPVERK